ncbi:MAG TPA: hypothetical protein PLG59_12850 [bacterium]|nr:hypothetical protein [bacterium]HQO35547.1 hypothetical protein [bacterium]HQP96863.1 hypothetical protein [bacterium]
MFPIIKAVAVRFSCGEAKIRIWCVSIYPCQGLVDRLKGGEAMKPKADKNRIKEIKDVYRSIGLQSEEVRKYFAGLGTLPEYPDQQKETIFIEAGITSCGSGGLIYAGLERASE